MTSLEATLFAVLGLLCGATLLLQLGIVRRLTPALEKAERSLAADPMSPDSGLHNGSTVPDFTVLDHVGKSYSLGTLLTAPRTAFLFASQGCPSCEHLMEELNHEGWRGRETLVVISDAPVLGAMTSGDRLLWTYQVGESASVAFRQSSLPQTFVVDDKRVVVARMFPTSLQDIAALIERDGRGLEVRSLDLSTESHHHITQGSVQQ